MIDENLYRLLVRDRARKRHAIDSEFFCDESTGESNEPVLFQADSPVSGIRGYDDDLPLQHFSDESTPQNPSENYQP